MSFWANKFEKLANRLDKIALAAGDLTIPKDNVDIQKQKGLTHVLQRPPMLNEKEAEEIKSANPLRTKAIFLVKALEDALGNIR